MDGHDKTKDRDGNAVCSGCVNSLGFNVTWKRAEEIGHMLPSYSEGGLRAVYDMGRAEGKRP